MKNFASLPTEYVFRALGMRARRSRDVQVLEFKPLACRSCGSSEGCSSCPLGYQKIKVRGLTDGRSDRPSTLKAPAVKLYMSLFFLTDGEGLVSRASYRELASLIGVCEKTIVNSINALSEAGFVSGYKKNNARYFSVSISGFKTMYFAGRKGGKGYVTLTREMFTEIAAVKGINRLRCIVKSVFNALYNQYKSSSKIPAAVISFENLRESLPKYVKPHVLREAVSGTSAFFDKVSEGYKEFTVILNPKFNPSITKDGIREASRAAVDSCIENLNRSADKRTVSREPHGRVSAGALPRLNLSQMQKNDIYNLCLEYPVPAVTDAVKTMYREYVLKHIKPDNPGGLLRNILKEQKAYGII